MRGWGGRAGAAACIAPRRPCHTAACVPARVRGGTLAPSCTQHAPGSRPCAGSRGRRLSAQVRRGRPVRWWILANRTSQLDVTLRALPRPDYQVIALDEARAQLRSASPALRRQPSTQPLRAVDLVDLPQFEGLERLVVLGARRICPRPSRTVCACVLLCGCFRRSTPMNSAVVYPRLSLPTGDAAPPELEVARVPRLYRWPARGQVCERPQWLRGRGGRRWLRGRGGRGRLATTLAAGSWSALRRARPLAVRLGVIGGHHHRGLCRHSVSWW